MTNIKKIMDQLPQNTTVSRQVIQAYLELHEDLLSSFEYVSAADWSSFAATDYIGNFSDSAALSAYLLERAKQYDYDHIPIGIDPMGFGEITLAWNGGHVFIIG